MSGGLAVSVRELRHLPEVWRAVRRPRAEIERRALREVNQLLAFCREAVPYYADDNRYAGAPLRTLAELAGLPVLDKPTLLGIGVTRFHTPALRPRDYRVDRTSGSTGVPLEVRHDVDAYGYHGATVFRRFLTSGYRPWWRIAQIKPIARPVRWFQRLGVFPRVVVPAGHPTAEITQRVLAVRPHLIMGYPVMLRALLRDLTESELATLRRTLRLVMTDSELLTPEVADWLSTGFGVPVYDEYSAYEVLTVSAQCRAGAMHVDEDRVWLEIIDPDGRPVPDGAEGAVVVTHFRERAMPLLRYHLGDRAAIVPGECPCGMRTRRMRITDGRINDHVVLPGGRRVYSGPFLVAATECPGVAETMVRQDRAGTITVHLVPDPRSDLSYEQAVLAYTRRVTELVGEPVPLAFVRARRIALTPGGKGKVVESVYRAEEP